MFARKPLAWMLLLALAGAGLCDDPDWRAAGRHVLVVYATDDADRNGNGKPDSVEAAAYYARRRGVPAENLLGLSLKRAPGTKGEWTYSEFFERILKPVSAKLSAAADEGETFYRRCCYILLAPGTPMLMRSHPAPAKTEKLWYRKCQRRSVDGYLISVAANLAAGVDAEAGVPGAGRSGPLGMDPSELTLPLFATYRDPAVAKHFRRLRRLEPERFDFALVARLGLSLEEGRDMLDGALYAERYLRLPPAGEQATDGPAIWLDQKYKFAQDHVLAMGRALALLHGLGRSPFADGEGLRRPWPLVIDNELAEIGLASGGESAGSAGAGGPEGAAPHKPTVTAKIASDGVGESHLTLSEPRRIGRRGRDVPPVLYFPPGCKVTNGQATATVIGHDADRNRLRVDSARGFAPGQTIRYVWPGEFPARDCFIFYGFYGLGHYEDVFQFPPGALGIHVDSCCMTWARRAMRRGIAATFGVSSEPLSAGIPYGDQVLLALSSGYDWAEAAYGGLRLGQRWTGVVFGDPVYAPFRSLQREDRTPPVLTRPKARVYGDVVVITAELAGATADELADVAQFKLEFGRTKDYGQTLDFFDWPEPKNSKFLYSRRFGYSRNFRWRQKGLDKGTYHFRLIARDPAGLETASPDLKFRL